MARCKSALSLASSLGSAEHALRVLAQWRANGPDAAREWLSLDPLEDPLLQELNLRLCHEPGPRLLLDGLWFCRAAGGITRVWEQILHCWQLPGLFFDQAPLLLIDRESCLARSAGFASLEMRKVDPLDCAAVEAVAEENASIARDWSADVFLSSWISTAGGLQPVCSELAFVHDCMPERSTCPQDLRRLRRRWLQGASAHLAVSADTAADVAGLLASSIDEIPWCHPAPDPCFVATRGDESGNDLWHRLCRRTGLQMPFVLLPATSGVGTYKNPEVVLAALQAPALKAVQLVLSGIGAQQRAEEFEQHAPSLKGRIRSVGLSDLELAFVYRHALAVVIPSRIEGFGLPVIEVMAAGGFPLIADSRGLREAGAEAALRFTADDASQLVALLSLLLDPPSSAWLQGRLLTRQQLRLQRLHSDLLGLALLVQARRAAFG